MTEPLLSVRHLSVDYLVGSGTFHALRDVSFDLSPGRVVGIVGETGCGKSTLAHAIPRLLPEPPAKVRAGEVLFDGTDLLQLPRWKIPYVRGTGIGMIFQEPINSLDPAFRIYHQVAEAIRIRRLREAGRFPRGAVGPKPFDYSRPARPSLREAATHSVIPPGARSTARPSGPAEPRGKDGTAPDRTTLRSEVVEFLRLVRVNDPETILDLFPHELSGGMRQRIMIATALSARPRLLIADEPTSALDVTIQAQVLTLMKELMEEIQTSILFIGHDLGVITEMADDVGVMYAGQLAEFGPVAEVFGAPRHPYTKALLRSIPTGFHSDGLLPSLSGSVPNLSRLPAGCTFAARCHRSRPECGREPAPALRTGEVDGVVLEHPTACLHPEPGERVA